MPWISGISDYTFSASKFSSMGFGPLNVDIAAAGGNEPFVLEAVVGAYDPEITRARLAECADCMPHQEVVHRGHPYYSWGEDFKGNLRERFSPPAYDHLGRGGRMSVQPGRVFRAVSYRGDSNPYRRNHRNAADSLWDSEEMRLVAQAMADLGAYAAAYTEADMSLAALVPLYEKQRFRIISNKSKPQQQEYSVSRMTDPPALLPFRAIASGIGLTSLDKPTHVFWVIVHDNHETARANAARLAARLRRGSNARFRDSLDGTDSANRDGDSGRLATGTFGAGSRRKVSRGISDARMVSRS